MASTSDMRTGLILKIDGSLYTVIEFGQNKTARAAAKVWAKLKGVDNNRTIEQTWNSGETIFPEMVDAPQFLKDGQEVSVLINGETDQPMGVELPDKIVVQVTYSEPGVKGDTATRTLKPATVETGATVNVPLFVNEGEFIRVNTKTGEYVERVKE